MIDLPKSFVYQALWDSLSGSSNFARHYFRNRCYFLFLTLLRYFNSGGLAYLAVYQAFYLVGLPIRIPTDRCLLTAPRGVSPFVASFFAI